MKEVDLGVASRDRAKKRWLVAANGRVTNCLFKRYAANFGIAFDTLFVILEGDTLVRISSLAVEHKAKDLARRFFRPTKGQLRNISRKIKHTLDDKLRKRREAVLSVWQITADAEMRFTASCEIA